MKKDLNSLLNEFGKHAEKIYALVPAGSENIFWTLVYLFSIKHFEEKQSRIFSDPAFPLEGLLFLDTCGQLELGTRSGKIQDLCFAERYKTYVKDCVGRLEIVKIIKIAYECGINEPIPPWFTFQRLKRVATKDGDAIGAINRHKKEFNDWGRVVVHVQTGVLGKPASQAAMDTVITAEPTLNESRDRHLNASLLKVIDYIGRMKVLKYEPVDYLGRLYEMRLGSRGGKKKGGSRLGEFYTQPELARLMARIALERYRSEIDAIRTEEDAVKFCNKTTIYDPACDTGGLLITASDVLNEMVVAQLEKVRSSSGDVM